MSQLLPAISVSVVHNPRARADIRYGRSQREILSEAGCADARAVIASWPGYAPTPLRCLAGLAARAGIDAVDYKDESTRFGLGSFKALGGAYAVYRLLVAQIRRRAGIEDVTADDLLAGRYRDLTRDITVTCATDGNHGRSVAWGAQRFGCRCVIYIHATVSGGREQAIARYGAKVVRISGNYDDSVRRAAMDAERYGRFVVSDTSYEGYLDVPRDVMQGYTVMVDEAFGQLADRAPPTHVFVQGGVGGLAAAVGSLGWERYGAARPRLIVVEPEQADCIFRSVQAGRPVSVNGDLETLMAGLSCGEVSLLAWGILEQGVDDVMTVNDQAAVDCMQLLARGFDGDPPVVAGESAVAGLAGFIGVVSDPALRAMVRLDATSRVLLFGSEGDTDPVLYRRIVGRDAQQVRAGHG
jgi:diaminopropionate ammonia-lyase